MNHTIDIKENEIETDLSTEYLLQKVLCETRDIFSIGLMRTDWTRFQSYRQKSFLKGIKIKLLVVD